MLTEPPPLGWFRINGPISRVQAANLARVRTEELREDGYELPYNPRPRGKLPRPLKRVRPDGTVELFRSIRQAALLTGISRMELQRCVAEASLGPCGSFWAPALHDPLICQNPLVHSAAA